jgi:hypothetical protein
MPAMHFNWPDWRPHSIASTRTSIVWKSLISNHSLEIHFQTSKAHSLFIQLSSLSGTSKICAILSQGCPPSTRLVRIRVLLGIQPDRNHDTALFHFQPKCLIQIDRKSNPFRFSLDVFR